MYKLYKTSDDEIIAYKRTEIKKKTEALTDPVLRGPKEADETLEGAGPRETTIVSPPGGTTVVFLHGLMSNSESSKAMGLYNYCSKVGIDFLAFDNFGHGQSSGDFKEQTISSWLRGLEIVLNEIVTQDVILIGSSAGGWTALLGALHHKKVRGVICIAPAPDFTEDIWNKISEADREIMKNQGWVGVRGDNCHEPYPISYQLIEEAKQHLLLAKDVIQIDCPVHLIHGMKDRDVPHANSLELLEKIRSENVVLKLIKDGDHSLSSPQFMRIIVASLEEMLESPTISKAILD